MVLQAVCDRRRDAKLLRQEKDEASPLRVCGRESLNAFILQFAGMKVFLFLSKTLSSPSGLAPKTCLRRFAD
jgi:hypothetical protein